MAVPEDIKAKIWRDFSEADRLAVLQLVAEFQEKNPEHCDRILRCLIFLANGSFENFARAIELARLDWRDLIVEAEYDGWYGEEHRRRNLNLPFET